MPETEYRGWQSEQFKKKAEAKVFPRLAQRLIDLSPPQEPTPTPSPPTGQEEFDPSAEGPPGPSYSYSAPENIPSQTPISSGYQQPTASAPPPGEGGLPDFIKGIGGALYEPPGPSAPVGRVLPGIGRWGEEQAQRYSNLLVSGKPEELGTVALETFPGAGAIGKGVGVGLPLLAGMAKNVGKAGKAAKPVSEVLHTDVAKFLSKFPSEEVQTVLKETIEANPQRFEAARRGVLPDKVVEEMASNLGLNAEDIIKKWKPGVAENAETLQNLRAALDLKTQQVLTLKEEAAKAVSEGIDPVAKKLQLQLAIGEQAALQEVVLGVRAEAGRSLRVFRRNVEDALARGNLDTMQEVLRSVGGKWSDDLIDQFLALPADNVQALYSFIRNAQQPEWWKYPLALRYSSLLSGPRTHIVNFVSNSLTTILSPVEAALAATAELRAPLTGRSRERFFGEVPSMLFGMVRGVPEGLKGALSVLKEGVTGATAAKLELRHMEVFTPATSRAITSGVMGAAGAQAGAVAPADSTEERIRNMGLGLIMGAAFGATKPAWAVQAINAPTRALAAADSLWRNINFSSAMYGQAYREAAKAGTSLREMPSKIAGIIANPSKSIVDDATKAAAYRVFQQEPGGFTRWILRGKNEFPVVQFIAPFIQTPVNLVKYGVERTPLGVANVARTAGGERSDALGRMLLGSGIMAAVAMYALDGKITGPTPGAPNSQERRAFESSGKIPYSILGADGVWHSYRRFEPFNLALTFAAEAVNAFRTKDEVPTEENLMGVVKTLSDNLVGSTWATGLFDVVDLLENPERSAGEYAGKATASFLPFSALLRTAGQVQTPEVKEPEGPGEALAASLGVYKDIPTRLNAYGEKELFQGNPLSPYRESKAKEEPHITEAARLEAVPADAPSRMLGVPISRESQAQMQQDTGLIIRTSRPDVVASMTYQKASDEDKQRMLKDTESIARSYVRAYLTLPAIAQGLQAAPKVKQQELMDQLTKSLSPQEMQRIARSDFPERPKDLGHVSKEIALAVQIKAYERSLPRYKGLSKQQEAAVDQVKARMRDLMEKMPENWQGKQNRALSQIRETLTDPAAKSALQEIQRIIQNPERYANPERRKIAKHPLMVKYYGDIEEEDILAD